MWCVFNTGLYFSANNSDVLVEIPLIDSAQKKPNKFISAEMDTTNNILWLGTFDKELYEYHIKTKKLKKINFKESLIRAVSLLYDQKHTLYIASNTKGIFLYEPGSGDIKRFFPENHNSQVELNCSWYITQDNDDNIWISQNNYLYQYSNNKLTKTIPLIKQKPGFHTPGFIRHIYCDNTGIIWFSHDVSGVDIYDPYSRIFEQFHIQTGSPLDNRNHVKSIVHDTCNNLWVGTYGKGIKLYDKHYRLIDSFPEGKLIYKNHYIRNIMPDSHNNMWISTLNGLIKYSVKNAGPVKVFNTTDNLWHKTIMKTFEDSKDNIWIITQEGLNKLEYSSQKILKYNTEDGLIYYKINDITEDAQQNIWIATYSGISKYEPEQKTFTNYYETTDGKTGLSHRKVNCILQHSNGSIWFGTDNGLNRYDIEKDTFVWFFEHDGLDCNRIENIQEGRNQTIWITTETGLTHYDVNSGIFKSYSDPDGLRISGGVLYMDKKGYLHLADKHTGFYVFHPDSIPRNNSITPVYITEICSGAKDCRRVLPRKKEFFKYNDRNIRIKFTALNYSSPEKSQYIYQLIGEDKNPVRVSAKNRQAVYHNLTPGEYTFHVAASNDNSALNHRGDKLLIEILPPWWLTWQAYILYLSVILALFFIYHKIQKEKNRFITKLRLAKEQIEVQKEKTRLQQEVNEQRTEFFTEISHEFRTPLTLISIPVDGLLAHKSMPEGALNKLTLIKKNVVRLQRLVNQIIDYRKISLNKLTPNPQQVEIVSFIKNIFNVFIPSFEKMQIDYIFNNQQNEYFCLFDCEMLDKIIYNLLSNALKHTPTGGKIELEIQFTKSSENRSADGQKIKNGSITDEALKISVSNTGKGIKPEYTEQIFQRFFRIPDQQNTIIKGSGIGLSIVKEYVTLLGGTIDVKSKPNVKTGFHLVFPVRKIMRLPDVNHSDKQEQFTINEYHEDIYTTIDNDTQKIPEQDAEKKVMLIVEDNKELLNILCELFFAEFNTISAENGQKGLELAIEHVPDIIISDIMMPVMDGFELCQKCKKHEFTSHVPVILLTSRADVSSRISGLEKGADAYLNKPFHVGELKTVVISLLKNRKHLRQKFSQKINLQTNIALNSPADVTFIGKINEIIDNNIQNENMTVELIANTLGMSLRQFHRKFKGIMKSSPGDYIRSYKLNKAAKLFAGDINASISEIAYSLGFKQVSHFSSAFKKQFGTSPSDFLSEKNL